MCPNRTVPPHRVYVNTPRIQRRPSAQAGRQLRRMTQPPWLATETGRKERIVKPAQGPGHTPENKKAKADAHQSTVRADSCLSGFWSMPCDLLLAAFSQRFALSRCAPAAPWPIPLHFRSVQPAPGFAAILSLAAGSPRRIFRGEKIPHGGWRAVFPDAAKTSTARGEGCKEPRRRGPGLSCAQASADFFRDQRRRSDLFLLISAAVLRLWQRWHRLWRLSGSVNTAQSPLWSRMWSTSVALVRIPC